MAWSYSGDPDSSALDSVRFLVGDTDTNDQLGSIVKLREAQLQLILYMKFHTGA